METDLKLSVLVLAVNGRLEDGAWRFDHEVATNPDPRTSEARQVGRLRPGKRWPGGKPCTNQYSTEGRTALQDGV
jgi:hypothetical protein